MQGVGGCVGFLFVGGGGVGFVGSVVGVGGFIFSIKSSGGGGAVILVFLIVCNCFFVERDNVQLMQEDPEDFFGDVGNFTAPVSVGPRLLHLGYELKRFGRLVGLGIV